MIYCDNAATSYPKPQQVPEAMLRLLAERGGNPGRSGHRLATGAEATLRECRLAIAGLFGIGDPDRVIFCLNATDALNAAIAALLRPTDHVVSTVLEHNSVNRPLYELEQRGAIRVDRVSAGVDGAWQVPEVLAAVRPETRLVAVTHCSNVLGVVCPVEELAEALRAKAPNARLLVDAAQTAGLVDFQVDAAGVDFVAVPGHKGLLGPTGTGALLIGPRAASEALAPWRTGGTGGDSGSPGQPRELPFLLEAGTPNTVGIAGLLAGVRYVHAARPGSLLAHERGLVALLVEELGDDPRFRLYGTREVARKTGVLSIGIEGLDPTEAASILDDAFGICVRPGLHCAPFAHKALGTFPSGTIRVSPGHAQTEAELGIVVAALREIAA